MASKKGTLLEKNVERLLRLSGLSPERNVIINTYEIDVFVIYKNKRIAFECKQYEKSGLTVRNLIH
jgi:Holliday junction resolvase